MFESLNSISSHVKSGSVRGLAVSGDRRSLGFPDLPTVAEAGVPGYSAPTWTGIVGPAGMPRAVVEKLNAALNRAIRTDAFKARYAAIGDEPAGGPPEEFAKTIASDSAKWKGVVERAGVKLD
jgi:tripartite-type tricarboxylate transporter receptor subunit TctC